VEAAFASRMAELGDGGESPLPSPAEAGESPAEPPGHAALMAALRASAGLGASDEAPLPADRRRRKRRSRAQPPPTPGKFTGKSRQSWPNLRRECDRFPSESNDFEAKFPARPSRELLAVLDRGNREFLRQK